MADYLHGAYGQINEVATRVTDEIDGAVVYIGTAPVDTATDTTVANINTPVLVRNMAEAKKYLGYSDDWAKYTLCEAMQTHFENNGVGPVVFINVLDPSASEEVTATDVIGSTDGMGNNTGIYAVKDVYGKLGLIPSLLVAPGFSSDKAVNAALVEIAKKISGHWDAYVFADLPTADESGNALTLETVATYKKANGYDAANEKVFFPLVTGVDDKVYHLSTLAAANFQKLMAEYDNIPYHSVSNTACEIIRNLRFTAEAASTQIFDDEVINEYLNKNGITSAAYVGGRWALWGPHSADFTNSEEDAASISDTSRLMLYYISNDFQARRMLDVDRPMTNNDIQTIVAEEQARIDALLSIGALTYGSVSVNAEYMTTSDIMSGDYSFTFNVTTTPLAKSLTAVVNWTDEGFSTYFSEN